ncbi:hypothetical protein H0H93_012819 [Arthromyces matolae]|nr:hypothetical protein H0H93_012819 [Arthromyces matolae]
MNSPTVSAQASSYELVGELKGNTAAASAITFNEDATMIIVGSDDGYVRAYSTHDFQLLQALYDKAWGKVTTLTYMSTLSSTGDKIYFLAIGDIRGSVSIIPKDTAKRWFLQKKLKHHLAFDFNDSVALASYDPLNQRVAFASHGGTVKLFNIDAGGKITERWVLPATPGILPASLAFFGSGNQSLLYLKVETGEM